MCGRIRLTSSGEAIADEFALVDVHLIAPRFNIPPGGPIEIIRADADGRRTVKPVLWGLVPSWQKEATSGLANAKAETAHEKPSFRHALRRGRCVIPVDGFYEWRSESGRKQPYHFFMQHGRSFALAGIWENSLGADGSELETAAILTTSANELMRQFHHRMPVILRGDDLCAWLDCSSDECESIRHLLVPYGGDDLGVSRVNPIVNNTRHDSPACIEPAA